MPLFLACSAANEQSLKIMTSKMRMAALQRPGEEFEWSLRHSSSLKGPDGGTGGLR